MNGYLKIKTKIDNSNIDKDIKALEDKIKKLQLDNSNNASSQESLQNEINNYEKLCYEADKYKEKIKQLNAKKKEIFNNNPSLAVSVDTAEYANIKNEIDSINQKYKNTVAEIDKQAPKIDKVISKLNLIKQKQSLNNSKMQEFKAKIDQINIKKVQNGLDDVGQKIQGQIGKIGKMALAVIGIRTAWNAVRSAINLVTQFNPQISADFEYMKYCIANLLVPAVQGLVKLLFTVLSYVNAISQAWFGINLFGDASAKNFQDMQKSANGTAKSSKEIQKSLQGFDEMNVLSSTSDNENSSSSISSPTVDLSTFDAPVPTWLQWILDNKDIILAVIIGIGTAIASLKILDLATSLGLVQTGLAGIKALGIGIAVAGIVTLIQDIIKFIKDPSFEGFLNILRDIAVVAVGIGIALGAWPLIIAGVITLIVTEIVKHWEEIMSVLGKVGKWIYDNVIKPVGDFFQSLWNTISTIFGPIGNFFKTIFETAFNNVKIVIDNLIKIFQFLWNILSSIFSPVAEFFGKIFGDAFNKIKNVFSNIISFFNGIFYGISQIFSNIGQKIGDVIGGALKGAINAVLSIVENVLNTPIRAINGLIGVINAIPGINLEYLGTFSLPRLAKGGVISQPTQAIIGEAGKEAVVPLENNLEWLDLLADKLSSKIGNGAGSYVLQIDSRTVQRGIAKRQQELAFATNGR